MLTATFNVATYAPFVDPVNDPVNDLITDAVMEVFPQSAIDSQSFKGDACGNPTDQSLHFLYYHTNLFDRLLNDTDWRAHHAEISAEYMGEAMVPKPVDDWTLDDFIA